MTINNKTDFLFETSWEVCNKVGGIHTVISTKVPTIEQKLKDNYILIGPDLNREKDKDNNNTEFIEDNNIYKNWRTTINNIGIKIRIGRWNIIGKPLVFLIDYSPLLSKKDKIFAELWETYKLDSLSGQWDYIEPAIFGYAAGMVIKNFYLYNLSFRQNIVAQFHEWMTGTGLLYLKKNAPHIATTFTTHATTLGRSIAGNNLPLYSLINNINADQKAKELNILAKHSLEKNAANEADAFTTVSQLTANEATNFLNKKIDTITPNGFENNIVPENQKYNLTKQKAHEKLKKVAEALFGYKLSENVNFIATSGRYEYKNKGYDIFIDVFNKLKNENKIKQETVALILVPAHNYGPRKDLIEAINNKTENKLENNFITHYLHNGEFDPIITKIKKLRFENTKNQKIKIIFIPAYLNGNDQILNINYYNILPALKLTIFPSYYEPWGYTPLESLAFHVPTITTNLAGFGIWINNQNNNKCISVINRNEENYQQAIQQITDIIYQCANKNENEIQKERKNAFELSKSAQWKNLIKHYIEAYSIAIENKNQRTKNTPHEYLRTEKIPLQKISTQTPIWRTSNILPHIPEKFKGLEELANNIWWEWNNQATKLFENIDPKLWEKSKQNPIKMLKEINYETFHKLEQNQKFLKQYEEIYSNFKKYINTEQNNKLPSIAYFSMEYGLTNILKIYSGGLGILAGDYLKQASDKNINLKAVGLLYKNGYFHQQLSIKGEQIADNDTLNYSNLPIKLIKDKKGNPITTHVGLPGRIVYIQIWKIEIGRIQLYLLDTDIDQNTNEDKNITHQLYGGNNEHRLKQEMILGIGGIRALRQLGIRNEVYHSNEGHSAFINIERIWQYMQIEKLTFDEALEVVRASTLFTTHTPVPAGHDTFHEDLIMVYLNRYLERLNISWEELIKLGKININDKNEKFSMSHLAANLSQEINGVSFLHGEVTKNMFAKLWEGYQPAELHIGHVTNGVHYQTWTSNEMKKLMEKYTNKKNAQLLYDTNDFNKILNATNTEIWELRNKKRKDLIKYIKNRINLSFVKQRKSPQELVAIENKVDDKILTLGFARRFAKYKRAHLLFYDTKRLANILNNPEKPVQIIFAGKAHPNDTEGQEIIKRILEISKLPTFLGKIIFLENYNINLAKKLVQGVDVWINTPTRPLEASGTSGMKATMNGVLNLSVLDGWWVEGYKKNAGWALPLEKSYKNQEFQNQLDAEMIYEILENEIIPEFYNRNKKNIPENWIKYIKNAIAEIAPKFTTARMLDDYINKFYIKLANRKKQLRKNDYEKTKQLSAWKKRMKKSWNNLQPITVKLPINDKNKLTVGKNFTGEILINLNEIAPENIAVEIVFLENNNSENKPITKKLKLINIHQNIATYEINEKLIKAGTYKYTFRIYPTHELLPHKQDFPLITWI